MSEATRELNRIAKTLGPSVFPTRFAIELCADCNLNCTMCHHDQMERPKGVMPFALFKKCVDEVVKVAPSTQLWISFCGEPLLEPELLVRAIAYAKSIGLESVNLNTNGMYLTPEWADPILKAGVDLVVFGIDGFEAETFESIRVGAKRDVVYANAEHILERRDALKLDTEIQIQFIFMEENTTEFEPFRDHWLKRGAVVKARRQLSWGGQFETALDIAKDNRIPCPWAITMMHVFWDGRVPRCPGDTEGDECAGNVWQNSLVELWAELGKYRSLHLAHQYDDLPERCQTCTDWMTGSADRIRPKAETDNVASA